jgi:5'-methylthioadenosine phosphorylase
MPLGVVYWPVATHSHANIALARPGEFLIPDQFVDRTWGRADTFYDGPVVTHISAADPYCPTLRRLAAETAEAIGIRVHARGTMVVIQGPRFSTRSESRWFRAQEWEVINMTNYPEAVLARELALCYVAIALVTDYDVGVEGDPLATPVTHEAVIAVMQENNDKLRRLLLTMVERLPRTRACSCQEALLHARLE